MMKMFLYRATAPTKFTLPIEGTWGKILKERKNRTPTVRQCPYCEKIFVRNYENMKKHTKVCRANEGITSCFDNGEIISFQDNFKYLGDVPFTVYFDFEATTDNTAFF